MKPTISDIARSFSEGKFVETYPFIADDAKWIVVGQNKFEDKQSIIQQCNKVKDYFNSVTTDFNTVNMITQGNQVAIAGTAEFLINQQTASFVSACDVYEFNEEGQIEKITSYCIEH